MANEKIKVFKKFEEPYQLEKRKKNRSLKSFEEKFLGSSSE